MHRYRMSAKLLRCFFLRCAYGCAGLVFLVGPSAGAGIQALESSVTTRAGTYLGASGWQYQQDTNQATGAAGLGAQASIGLTLGGASTTVNSTASLSFADSGSGSLHYFWTNRADVPGGPGHPGSGGSVGAVFAPASIYNSSGQVTAIATYAFTVGGDGAVSLNWNVNLEDPNSSANSNNLTFRHIHVALAALDRFHNGQLVANQVTDPQLVRSTGNTSLPFTAEAGDTLVLRLLPSYQLSQDGSRVNSILNGDLNLQFSVSAVPEPQTYVLMFAGVGIVAWASRRRKPV